MLNNEAIWSILCCPTIISNVSYKYSKQKEVKKSALIDIICVIYDDSSVFTQTQKILFHENTYKWQTTGLDRNI